MALHRTTAAAVASPPRVGLATTLILLAGCDNLSFRRLTTTTPRRSGSPGSPCVRGRRRRGGPRHRARRPGADQAGGPLPGRGASPTPGTEIKGDELVLRHRLRLPVHDLLGGDRPGGRGGARRDRLRQRRAEPGRHRGVQAELGRPQRITGATRRVRAETTLRQHPGGRRGRRGPAARLVRRHRPRAGWAARWTPRPPPATSPSSWTSRPRPGCTPPAATSTLAVPEGRYRVRASADSGDDDRERRRRPGRVAGARRRADSGNLTDQPSV